MKKAHPPLPDLELLDRVGSLHRAEDPFAAYEEEGRRIRDQIVSLLPADWSWDGRRVLDFGCGAGRVLRHFLEEADRAEFYGCDIDRPSIAWLDGHLSPPLHVLTNDEAPPLPIERAHFDLIYAVSVFTHISDHWATWLLEVHRLLKPDGLLIATFLGPGMYEVVASEAADEDRIGMNVLNHSQGWDQGGPTTLHSRWWIRAHWGRLFEIVDLRPQGFAGKADGGHGVAVMRRKPVELTPDDLTALELDEPREVAALQCNIEQLHRQNARKLEALQRLASWRLTRPLRAAKKTIRTRRR